MAGAVRYGRKKRRERVAMYSVEDYRLIAQSKYFNAAWYRKTYEDVKKAQVNPLEHFLNSGWKEMRNPGPWFSTRVYLEDNPDVREAGINPLLHFEKTGKKEGRKNKYGIIKKKGYVEEAWYRKTYPEADFSSMDPVEHYILFGWREGKDAGSRFSTAAYFMANPDCRDRKICPALHYEFEVNPSLRMRDQVVVHFWGAFGYEGSNYLIFSSLYGNFRIRYGERWIEPVKVENSGAALCFEEYIRKEYSEYGMFFPADFLKGEKGETFEIIQGNGFRTCIRTLFVWSAFSYGKILGRDRFFYYKGNKVTVTGKPGFVWMALEECSLPRSRLLLKAVLSGRKRRRMLFSEFRGIANDNSWELFKRCLEEKYDAYFVTSQTRISSEENPEIKKRLVAYNSKAHKKIFLQAAYICCSWTLSDMVPTEYKHDFIMYPFLNQQWYYCPHGISYDKNSNFLTPVFLGQPRKIFCCSELEKKYFEEKCGLENVYVTGYPRMDKWDAPVSDDILFNFTYRKEYSERYFRIIAETVRRVREEYPDRKVCYLFHPAVTPPLQRKIKQMIHDHSVEYAHASNQEKFNLWFNRSRYLVTDYSSVAYDFAYRENAFAVYYLPEGFTEGHYSLNPQFYGSHVGIVTYCIEELLETLGKKEVPDCIGGRKRKFFRYRDRNNCERVLAEMTEDEV